MGDASDTTGAETPVDHGNDDDDIAEEEAAEFMEMLAASQQRVRASLARDRELVEALGSELNDRRGHRRVGVRCGRRRTFIAAVCKSFPRQRHTPASVAAAWGPRWRHGPLPRLYRALLGRFRDVCLALLPLRAARTIVLLVRLTASRNA